MAVDPMSLGQSSAARPGEDLRLLVVGDLAVDLSGREVRLANRLVPLTRIEFDLVAYLAAHPGWVVSPDQLMEEVWGYRSMGDTRAVAVHIGNVRRKLGDSTTAPKYIQTVRGAGYKLVRPEAAPPTQVSATAPTTDPPTAPAAALPAGPFAAQAATVAAPSAPVAAADAGPAVSPAPPSVSGSEPGAGGLVGREREKSILGRAWDEARRGHGGIILLSGDSGIGKTRLAEELGDRVGASGGVVAWGRCHETEGLPAYWPWVQILRDLLESSSDDELRRDIDGGAAALSVLIPELRQRVGDIVNEEPAGGWGDRERFFRAVIDYLVCSSRRHPLLLVLDDLHVGDPSSLLLLQAIAPEVGTASLLILATYRDTELEGHHPFGETLAILEHTHCHRLHVSGLSTTDVGRVMSNTAEMTISATLAAAVHEQTAGNPLFVVELTRLLAAEGHLVGADPGSLRTVPMPSGVRSVLDRLVSRLSPACRELLGLAALLGRSIDLLVLSGASGLSGDPLLALLDEAIAARLVEKEPTPGRFRFVHPLMQEVLAGGHSEGDRLRMHARIGEALETYSLTDPDAFLPDLAYHFSRAAALGYGPRAFDYSRCAGTSALSRYGYEEAAEHFSRAVSLLPCSGLEAAAQRAQAAELHEAIGDALSMAARRGDAVHAYQRATTLLPPHDSVTRARLERKRGAAWLADQEPARAQACFDSAEVTLGQSPPGSSSAGTPTPSETPETTWAREKIELSLHRMAALYFSGDREGLASLLEETRDLIEAAGTGEQRATYATHYLGLAFRQERYRIAPNTLAYARDHWRRLHMCGDSALACEAEFQLGFALLCAGELDEAHRHLHECALRAEAARDLSRLVRAITYSTIFHRMRGQTELARAGAERAIVHATLAHLPGYVAAGRATLGWVALRDGDPVQAEAHAHDALELWRSPSAYPFEWLARWPLAALAVRQGRDAEAHNQLAYMLDPGQQRLPDGLAAAMAAALDPANIVGGVDKGTRHALLETAVHEAVVLNYC